MYTRTNSHCCFSNTHKVGLVCVHCDGLPCARASCSPHTHRPANVLAGVGGGGAKLPLSPSSSQLLQKYSLLLPRQVHKLYKWHKIISDFASCLRSAEERCRSLTQVQFWGTWTSVWRRMMSTFNHCAAQILHYRHNGAFSRAGIKKTFGGQLCTRKENH